MGEASHGMNMAGFFQQACVVGRTGKHLLIGFRASSVGLWVDVMHGRAALNGKCRATWHSIIGWSICIAYWRIMTCHKHARICFVIAFGAYERALHS